MSGTPQPPFSARAATRGDKELGNGNPSHAAGPVRALFLESARAATRGVKELGNICPSRVTRPVRALFLERRNTVHLAWSQVRRKVNGIAHRRH